MKLSEILDRRCIKLDMYATKKSEAIEELVNLLLKTGKVSNIKGLADELMAQEEVVSTGIGQGIAIPHKLVSHVQHAVMAFGRKADGIKFNAIDKQPVTLLFLILGPKGKPTEHLQLLSKLSRFLHQSQFKECLLNAQTADEIWEAIRRQEEIE